jgi:hypothetical protein
MQHHQTPSLLPFRRLRRQQYRILCCGSRFLHTFLNFPSSSRLSPHQLVHTMASSTLYILGPLLVIVTFSLLFCLSWTFWNIIIPLRFGSYDTPAALIHQGFVVFVLMNIAWNYILCVCTNNSHTSNRYKVVVKELKASSPALNASKTFMIGTFNYELNFKF